ncbi:hydrolase, putative [Perkinsus marinus ATCC 50983]|uniref:Hydrolase, putative n=1 Tax=Perkinsus marinus (strain ATCC 50983 / TXsc) TaxID=423536 RepID=C5K8F0_PERM5|nr:hydrolase, putative [Perkinsus marinus ATCC 50983]EER19248.1 hydrolase, putative [Perkinsus marinus ATCC 50983]|eukprot:XP_002787452.1 hydrolase, putative [Perkinsus marinus ATCC 50983]
MSTIVVIRQLVPKVLYYRRRYSDQPEYYNMITAKFTASYEMPFLVEWQDSHYKQVAYVVPPVADRPPSRAVWLLLGGNAMLAKDWLPFVYGVRRSDSTGELNRATFLLVDYPEYGESRGPPPCPDSMNVVVNAAVKALVSRAPQELDSLHILGHSLGGAVALRFAREEIHKSSLPVKSVITSSTFTSIAAMIRSITGIPQLVGKLLASHEWLSTENMIYLKTAGVKVAMVHGQQDEIVPYSQGEELSEAANVTLFTHPSAEHNDILSIWVPNYAQLMANLSGAKL